ncbi:3-dehydroquinate synthase [Salinicoccus kekensis]|uniref:3-dehydroquinate synthase n=1 Tax=Salinicoccus kekensis TaxID=714307 RepID=A0A285UA98_9STAP|nr:3-dehydroquinate synthase family protein [Salinicoccus kekensis]SOC38835.1 3-dehydroquinate synthase [Salinicoccus kekensis]
MKEFETTYPDENYTVHVGHGIFKETLNLYTSRYEDVFYIIDENVHHAFKNTVLKDIEDPVIAKPGEAAKTAEAFIGIVESLLGRGIKRSSLVVVIGGGAVGDAGGFAAAVTLRGVDFIQVPTTLLAHDSAIGGKTAINSRHGKNLIGAFHRPSGVIYDLDFLNTLPESEILSGFGEVYKHALLDSEKAANELMEQTAHGVEAADLEDSIIKGIRTKMRYVTEDEFESGSRKYLNLGHTLGHAIEYEYKIQHGHAVMLGLYAMMFISNEQSESRIFDLEAHYTYLSNLGYPMELLGTLDSGRMLKHMKHDKKNISDASVGFILMDKDFEPFFTEINTDEMVKYIGALKESL